MSGVQTREREHNAVHDDAIWRQMVRYELTTAKNWTEQWGFMRDVMKSGDDTTRDTTAAPRPANTRPECKYQSGLPSLLPAGLAGDNSLLNNLKLAYAHDAIIKYRPVQEKYAVPCTTGQEIGWGWNRLERGPAPRPHKMMIPGMGIVSAGTTSEEETVVLPPIDQPENRYLSTLKGRHLTVRRASQTKEALASKSVAEDPKMMAELAQMAHAPAHIRSLELYGRHGRGRGSVLRWWGGNLESLP